MRWQGRRESDHVEDRRGSGMILKGGIGTIVIGIIYLLLGGDPSAIINNAVQQTQTNAKPRSAEEEKFASFSKVVLADTEDVWSEIFKTRNETNRKPILVLFTEQIQSGCGFSSAATGPFYCPSDEKRYWDLSFFSELDSRFGAPGEFAMAYVIAHKVGHHVQQLMGVFEKTEQQRQILSQTEYNKLSVKMELRADFYAGVWANRNQQMKNSMESGDIKQGNTFLNEE